MTNQATSTERSAPLKVTGRLKVALDAMVWKALTRAEAAAEAGLREHSLYVALRKAHVKAWYLAECEVLRMSGRAKRLHRLEAIALQDENRNAAVAAIKAAEELGDDRANERSGFGQVSPGLTIVIQNAPPVLQPRGQTTTIDAQPVYEAPQCVPAWSEPNPTASHQPEPDEPKRLAPAGMAGIAAPSAPRPSRNRRRT